jgi:HAD superfamily hydrolase (TIGR01509 family)
MLPSYVVFDLDGLLIDSEPYWRDGFRAGLAAMAARADGDLPTLTDEDLVRFEGGRVPDTLTELARHYLGVELSRTDELLETGVTAALESAMAAVRDHPAAIGPSRETAIRLHEAGCTLAVASSSALSFIEAALEAMGIADRFTVVVSAFELEHAKPHPQVYLDALAGLGAEPSDSVAVEDSKVGVEAALRAGLRTVWVSTAADRALFVGDEWPRLVTVDDLSVDVIEELMES